MFGIELIRDGKIADRATVVLDNLDDALIVAKQLIGSAERTSQKVRVIDQHGAALGVYYVNADRFVSNAAAIDV